MKLDLFAPLPRRTVIWTVGAIAFIGAIFLLGWMRAGKRLHVENFSRIRPGMPQSEVESLLGGPPGNYGRYSANSGMITQELYLQPPGSVERLWYDDAHRFEIYFDQQGRVVGLHKRGGYEQASGLRSWLDFFR